MLPAVSEPYSPHRTNGKTTRALPETAPPVSCSYLPVLFRTGGSFRETSDRKPIEHVEVLGCLNHKCSCYG